MEYRVTLKESSKELTVKEKIQMKDTSNAHSLDHLTLEAQQSGNRVIIDVDFWCKLEIYNEKSDDKNYINFIVVDKEGNKYVTGSNSFITSFLNMATEMLEAGEDDFKIEVYRKQSKNYKGKDFITCSIL